MREIKFRAWLKEEKRMLDKVALNWPGAEMIIQWYDSLDDYYAGSLSDCSERDAEVMQYTGLKDKNGREIYEGDILQITCDFKNRKDVVMAAVEVWNCSYSCGDWLLHELIDNGAKGKQEWEIVGSIHENPELLEV